MKKTSLIVFICASFACAPFARAADGADAPPGSWREPASYAGMAAVAAGALGLGFGALRVSQNGDKIPPDQFYRTGPAGFLYMGSGVALAMGGAMALDWARLSPAERSGRSARTRRWALATVGLGALAAGAGAALVMDSHNDARREKHSGPDLGAGRLVGWPAIVLGSAAMLLGVEGLVVDAFTTPTEAGGTATQLGLNWRGRF